jgi:hypothetical protein
MHIFEGQFQGSTFIDSAPPTEVHVVAMVVIFEKHEGVVALDGTVFVQSLLKSHPLLEG